MLEIYLAVTFALNCDLKFNKQLEISEDESTVRKLQFYCDIIIVVSFVIFIGLIISAVKLLRTKYRNEGDEIRHGGNAQVYQTINVDRVSQ